MLAMALLIAVVGTFVGVIVTLASEHTPPLLGENTTQVLSTMIGGIIGILGAYLGRRRDSDR